MFTVSESGFNREVNLTLLLSTQKKSGGSTRADLSSALTLAGSQLTNAPYICPPQQWLFSSPAVKCCVYIYLDVVQHTVIPSTLQYMITENPHQAAVPHIAPGAF